MTFFLAIKNYNNIGDKMKVKIFDLEDEGDLEKAVNNFLKENDDIEVVDLTEFLVKYGGVNGEQ